MYRSFDGHSSIAAPVGSISGTRDQPVPRSGRKQIVPTILLAALFATLGQIFFFFSVSNSLLTLSCFLGVLITTAYLNDVGKWRSNALSTIMLAGYSTYYFLLPPLVMLSEGAATSTNLDSPASVVLHSHVTFFALLAAHVFCYHVRNIATLKNNIQRVFLKRMGLFAFPSIPQIAVISAIGLISVLRLSQDKSAEQVDASIGHQLLYGLMPYSFFALILFVPRVFGGNSSVSRTGKFMLMLYLPLLLIVALLINSRSAFFSGLASVALAWIWYLCVVKGFSGVAKKKFLVLSALGIVLLPTICNFMSAMVIARAIRHEASPVEVARKTVSVYMSGNASKALSYGRSNTNTSIYEEYYCANPAFARLCNLRFLDRALEVAKSMNRNAIQQYTNNEIGRCIDYLPRQVPKLLKLRFLDIEVVEGSGGDALLYFHTRDPYVLGGFRTGSIAASSFAIFGWAYPLAIFVIAVVIFVMYDLMVTVDKSKGFNLPYFSPVIIIFMYPIAAKLTSAATGCETFSSLAGVIIRNWWEMVIIYAVLYWSSRFMTFFVGSRSLRR